MESLGLLISGIDYKLRLLTERYKESESKNLTLTSKITELEDIINQQNQKINELETKLIFLNISKSIASKQDIAEAKQKIGELVREIDKSIGLLNK